MNSIETYTDAQLCDAILRKNFTSVGRAFIDDKVRAIRHFAFNGCTSIDTVSCPNAVRIGRQAFNGCKATTVDLPWDRIVFIDYRAFYGSGSSTANPCRQSTLNLDALVEIGEYAFANAGAYTAAVQLERVSAAMLENIPVGAFRNQTGLVEADFPVGKPSGSSAFEGCTSLKRVHFGGDVTTIQAKTFNGCTDLDTLILDGVTAVPSISNINAFAGTAIEAGNGYVYAPRALLSDFQSASRWSGFSFRALEDYPNA